MTKIDLGKPIVLCDVDGVIANYSLGIIRACRSLWIHEQWEVNQITQYDIPRALGLNENQWHHLRDARVFQPGFCASLEIYDGAWDGVCTLMEIANLFFVTQPWNSPHWHYERVQWLAEHFGHEAKHRTIFTHNKNLMKGHMLIEDNPDNLRDWCSTQNSYSDNWTPVLWDRPYNRDRDPGIRMSNWASVHEAVAKLKPWPLTQVAEDAKM